MSYKVRIESFEGPFDLLLYLVSRQKVDIGAISITQIIDQYLAEMQSMRNVDLDVASDFLLVASTLLKIKAESLLPREREIELDEDIAQMAPSEARDMLVDRLIVYKQYKNAAANLKMRFENQGKLHTRDFGPEARFQGLTPDYLRGVTLDSLATAAAKCYARRETFLLDSEHIAAKPLPVETYVTTIKGRIQNKGKMRFSHLVDARTEKPVIVVTFLAVLELYKRGVISVRQDQEFGDIEMIYLEGSDV